MNASAVKAQLKDEIQAFEFGSVDLLTPRSAVAEVRRLRGFIKQMKDVHVAEMARNVHLREEAFTTEEILGMGESEKAEYKKVVVEAARKREKKRRRQMKKAALQGDYSRGICGTAEDTSVEKEMSELAKSGSSEKGPRESPYLAPVEGPDSELQQFREDPGAWVKMLNANEVWCFLNVYTHEITGLRPECYEDVDARDKDADGGAEEEDVTGGLEVVESDDLLDVIETAIEDRKTTLILDPSHDEIMKTYFSYKGIVLDLSPLAKTLGEQRREGITPKKMIKAARQTIVKAAKGGATLAVFLGSLGADHLSLKDKFCKKPLGGPKIFPNLLFHAAGKDLIVSKAKGVRPPIEKLYKESDKEGGCCIYREKFNVVFISSHMPKEYVRELEHSLPLEKMKPVFLKTDRT